MIADISRYIGLYFIHDLNFFFNLISTDISGPRRYLINFLTLFLTFKYNQRFKNVQLFFSNVPERVTTQSGSSSPSTPEANSVEKKRETTRTATSGSELAKYKTSFSNYEIVQKKILRRSSECSD